MANKLVRITDGIYESKDKRYRLEKGFSQATRRITRAYRLYFDGEYIGMPESVADANKWINQR